MLISCVSPSGLRAQNPTSVHSRTCIILSRVFHSRASAPMLHIIAARTMGAQNPTIYANIAIPPIIHVSRILLGNGRRSALRKTITIVILKPLTAIMCMSPEF